MIAVVDYCKGNLKSVDRALRHVGGETLITDDPAVIAKADAIVLPGVGAFADAATTMQRLGQVSVIRDRILAGVPFLGICLGLHLMFDEGTEGIDGDNGATQEREDLLSCTRLGERNDSEGARKSLTQNARGLSILPGVAAAMPRLDAVGKSYKVPHVGWNSLEFDEGASNPLLRGIPAGEYFYFTHSFVAPHTPFTLATTTHSITFPSVVSYRDTAFGVQFHPEKSSDAGAVLLGNFLSIVKGA